MIVPLYGNLIRLTERILNMSQCQYIMHFGVLLLSKIQVRSSIETQTHFLKENINEYKLPGCIILFKTINI
jgi:hypothetical protein